MTAVEVIVTRNNSKGPVPQSRGTPLAGHPGDVGLKRTWILPQRSTRPRHVHSTSGLYAPASPSSLIPQVQRESSPLCLRHACRQRPPEEHTLQSRSYRARPLRVGVGRRHRLRPRQNPTRYLQRFNRTRPSDSQRASGRVHRLPH
jgi:hypothetical protein